MHKTLIPLDMIFISNGTIIHTEDNLKPCLSSPYSLYGPNELVDTVIELVAGEVDRLNLEVGDNINIYKIVN